MGLTPLYIQPLVHMDHKQLHLFQTSFIPYWTFTPIGLSPQIGIAYLN
jgi:hypothetical protein